VRRAPPNSRISFSFVVRAFIAVSWQKRESRFAKRPGQCVLAIDLEWKITEA
jgi:hypothetical protein